MPRYFFHSEDGHLAHDAEGTELADVGAARIEPVRLAGGLLSDRPQALWESSRWRLLVTDASDAIDGVAVRVGRGAEARTVAAVIQALKGAR